MSKRFGRRGVLTGGANLVRRTVVWSKAKKSTDRLADARRIEELRNDFVSGPGPDEIGTLLALDPRLVSKLKASIAASAGEGQRQIRVRHGLRDPPHNQGRGFRRDFSHCTLVWRYSWVLARPSDGSIHNEYHYD
jgi:hypothetical protein